MNITISNYNLSYYNGRNVINATIYDMENKPLMTDVLTNLLLKVKKEKHVVMNPMEILETVVLKFGAGA